MIFFLKKKLLKCLYQTHQTLIFNDFILVFIFIFILQKFMLHIYDSSSIFVWDMGFSKNLGYGSSQLSQGHASNRPSSLTTNHRRKKKQRIRFGLNPCPWFKHIELIHYLLCICLLPTKHDCISMQPYRLEYLEPNIYPEALVPSRKRD